MKNLDESFGVCAQSGQINTVKISETKSWTFCMSLTCLWVFMLVYKELWHKVSLFQVIVVQLLSSTDSLWPHGLQHARPLCPPLSLGVCSNSCPLSQYCYLTISSSAASTSSCLQSFPASESYPMSRLVASSGQSIGALASRSVLPMSIQSWFLLGLTSLISVQSKGLSRESSTVL